MRLAPWPAAESAWLLLRSMSGSGFGPAPAASSAPPDVAGAEGDGEAGREDLGALGELRGARDAGEAAAISEAPLWAGAPVAGPTRARRAVAPGLLVGAWPPLPCFAPILSCWWRRLMASSRTRIFDCIASVLRTRLSPSAASCFAMAANHRSTSEKGTPFRRSAHKRSQVARQRCISSMAAAKARSMVDSQPGAEPGRLACIEAAGSSASKASDPGAPRPTRSAPEASSSESPAASSPSTLCSGEDSASA